MSDHTFTVGERVAVTSYGRPEAIAKIDRITPSGQIVIGNVKYRPNGRRVGSDGSWSLPSIEPLTPEIERAMFRRKAISHIRGLTEQQISALTDDDLRAIVAILDRAKDGAK